MGEPNSSTASKRKGLRQIATGLRPYGILIAILIVAHFALANRFGLYEDDLQRVPPSWRMSTHEILDTVATFLFRAVAQGRPLHEAFIRVFSWLSGRTGDPLLCAYAIAAFLSAVNAILFFLLCLRLGFARNLAAATAAFFVLWPPDATHAFLTHVFGLQTSEMFLLAALHCYVGGNRKLAWVPASLCLLTYETHFMPFLAAPLLLPSTSNRSVPRVSLGRLAVHGAIGGGILVTTFAIRLWLRDGGLLAAGPKAPIALSNVVLGPLWASFGVIFKPVRAAVFLNGLEWDSWILLALGAALTVLVCMGLFDSDPAPGKPERKEPFALAMAGVACAILAYVLTLTVAAEYSSLFGRASRVHAAARLGFSLLFAAGLTQLSDAGTIRIRRAAAATLGLWMTLAFANSQLIQRDYARSWQLQRQLWTDVANAAVPVSPGLELRLPTANIVTVPEILTVSWACSLVLNDVFRFPVEWKERPRFYRFPKGSTPDPEGHNEPALASMLGPHLHREIVRLTPWRGRGMETDPAGPGPMPIDPGSKLARVLLKRANEQRVEYIRVEPNGQIANRGR